MSEKADPSFQKARDEALRALVQRGGLTPDQVSAVKLNQVHLATGTLVIEPDEFDSSAASGPPIRLQLDSAMQRALIAWLVVRPDGPNSHLFPGTGEAGLDVESIKQVTAAEQPTEKAAAPPPAERKKAETPPEPVASPPPTAARDEGPVPPPPPVATPGEEPEAVPLDEIESLRQRLAKTYDAWAPAVTAAAVRRAAEPPPDVVDSKVPSQPVVTPPSVEEPMPGREEIPVAPAEPEPAPGMPPSGPQETVVAEPMREPSEEAPVLAPVPPPSPDASQGLWWRLRNKKVSLRLTGFRLVAVGGLALLLVICCVGLGLAGGTMLGTGEGVGFLAGATPTETQTPTQTLPPATPTTAPSPSATVTTTSTPAPSATPTVSSPPTSTPGPTPTPVVIVVTATPTPEPSPSATPVPTEAPEGEVPPEPTPTEVPGFKYSAPVLLWPQNGSTVPGVINVLKWEPVGVLEDGEWYATRLVYRQQGELTYAGDKVKIPEWRVPDRLYYAADGPDLEYSWYVFVEGDSLDGTPIQLSPESETFVFRWE